MKRNRLLLLALIVLLGLLLLLTRLQSRLLHLDMVEVDIDIRPALNTRAQALDTLIARSLNAIKADPELRARLNWTPRKVELDAFSVDVCEVTQEDFERFAAWSRRHRPDQVMPETLSSSSSGHRIAGLLKSPASGVSYLGAAAYCEAAGGRLPWAEEWEAVAAGQEGRLYAWGDEWNADFWPYQSATRNASQVCGTHPQAASPRQVQDLTANVMEWSQGSHQQPTLERRPGAHGAPAARARARALYALNFAWLEIDAETRSLHLGFRCVYDQPQAEPLPWGGVVRRVNIPGGSYPVGPPPEARLPQLAALFMETGVLTQAALTPVDDGQKRSLEMSRCEVSRRNYQHFLNDPLARFGLFANENEPRHIDYTPLDWAQQQRNLDLPVSGINWWAADAFARWAGGTLPTRDEWRLVAAGPELLPYPWGREYQAGAAVTGDQAEPGLRPCASAAQDRNAAGIDDLGGNLSEWTRSVAVDRGGLGVWVMGGNWLLPGKNTASGYFGRLAPLGYQSPTIGLRVVYLNREM